MKSFLTSFLIILSFLSSAQISGIVSDNNGEPVEFATLFNLSKQTSSISNAKGIFELEGELGDSIRIQHLNCLTSEFKIVEMDGQYSLSQKNYDLDEVVISADYAAQLFKKVCENSYNKLKHKNVSRGFLRKVRIENNDTVQLIDLDLDIVQRKQKRYNLEDNILPSKVQSRIVTDTSSISKLRLDFDIFPNFSGTDWGRFHDYFNYFKVEGTEHTKLYFLNKACFKDSISRIEVVIQNSDSCLSSISLVSKKLLKNRKGDILKMKTIIYWHVTYCYHDGFTIIDEINSGLILSGSESDRKDISIFQFFKTYNSGAVKLETRRDGVRIFHNSLNSRLIKNKYEKEFWKEDSYLDTTPFDYKYLLDFSF